MPGETNPSLSIVVPAYNEKGNTRVLCDELDQSLDGKYAYEIIFVDDGSTDGTSLELQELWQAGRAKVLKLRRNFGQSAALSAGIKVARGDIIVTLDADLQNDPGDIDILVNHMKDGYDVVCGWRHKRNDSLPKKFLSKLANWLRRRLTSEPVHDSGCTLRVYKRECLQDLELHGEMHRFIPALLYWQGYRVGECPVNHRFRKFGTTKYGWRRLGRGFLDLLVVSFWQKYSLRPIHMFGTIGFILVLLGFGTSVYLSVQRLLFSTPISDRPLLTFGLFSIVIGLQFIAFGLLADITLRVYYSVRNLESYSVDEFLD